MACWQTGVPWAPPVELLNSNLASALEHVATHFAQWTRQLARAVAYHKRHPATEEARRCSGRSYGQHGLTYQQWRDREDKRKATRDYYHAIDFHVEDQAAKGRRNCQPAAADKGKDRKRHDRGRGAAEHSDRPRHYHEMWDVEQWLVYWSQTGAQRFSCPL